MYLQILNIEAMNSTWRGVALYNLTIYLKFHQYLIHFENQNQNYAYIYTRFKSD